MDPQSIESTFALSICFLQVFIHFQKIFIVLWEFIKVYELEIKNVLINWSLKKLAAMVATVLVYYECDPVGGAWLVAARISIRFCLTLHHRQNTSCQSVPTSNKPSRPKPDRLLENWELNTSSHSDKIMGRERRKNIVWMGAFIKVIVCGHVGGKVFPCI